MGWRVDEVIAVAGYGALSEANSVLLRRHAEAAGFATDRITAQTRHKRLSTLIERYIRPLKPWSTPPVETWDCE